MDRAFISQAFGAVPVRHWAVLVWHLMQMQAWAGWLVTAGRALPRLAVRSDGVIVDAGAERLEDYWDSAHYQAELRRWAAPLRAAHAAGQAGETAAGMNAVCEPGPSPLAAPAPHPVRRFTPPALRPVSAAGFALCTGPAGQGRGPPGVRLFSWR